MVLAGESPLRRYRQIPGMKWPVTGILSSVTCGAPVSFLLKTRQIGRFSGEGPAVGYAVALWSKEEKRDCYELRIDIRQLQWEHKFSDSGERAFACLQSATKEGAVKFLQVVKAQVPQPCGPETGSPGDGNLPRDVSRFTAKIRGHGQRHSAK